jgi:hypothetical protein
MPTTVELRALATEHEIVGRSKMDHLELAAALQNAGVDVGHPVFPETQKRVIEWRQRWRLVRGKSGKPVREKVDGEWQTIRETDDAGHAEMLAETLKLVWPHGQVRVRTAD